MELARVLMAACNAREREHDDGGAPHKAVVLCAPSRGGKSTQIARALADDDLRRAAAIETAAADETWGAVLAHARAFAQKRLVQGTVSGTGSGARRKVFVIDDLDVFAACDRACTANIKPLAKFCAERDTTLVLACPPEFAAKLKRDRLAATELRVERPGAPAHAAASDLDAAVRAVLTGEADIDRAVDYLAAFGGHMFVDTLAHNAAASCDAAVYLARAARSLAPASMMLRNTCDADGARDACNLARACAWHRCTGSVAGPVKFTNSLSLCNVYARARRLQTEAAARNGHTLAEQVFMR